MQYDTHYYQHSPTCFGAYCAIFREKFILCSKLSLCWFVTDLLLYMNLQ